MEHVPFDAPLMPRLPPLQTLQPPAQAVSQQ
jgi:hypothetical protein